MDNNEIRNSMELNDGDLEQVSGGASSNKNQFVKATGNVYVRKGPGKNYKDIGTLSTGTVVSYLGDTQWDDRDIAWYKINYNGNVGWVSSKYAKRI